MHYARWQRHGDPRIVKYEHHGLYKDSNGNRRPEHIAWDHMLQRCYNNNNQRWHRYGARGIRVCPRWRNSFKNFLRDMGERPSLKHTLERRNNNGDYTPSNCIWATNKEQTNNTGRNICVTAFGRTQTISQWADEYHLNYKTLYHRIKKGWMGDRLFSPADRRRPKKYF